MGESPGSLEAAEFARHERFVRRVALRMAADETVAEDLAQDAWLAAIENPPSAAGLRSWFVRVVRNKLVQRVRSESRRRVREQGRAREEHAEDTAELVERMELHQRVVQAVLDLPEPYRSVLVRRFSMEEEVPAIAARLGLPEATVRTRLRRGLEKLRERLRGEMGGTPALFLLSLRRLAAEPSPASVPPSAAPLPAGPLILSLVMKKAVLLTAVALAALAVVWSVSGRESAPQAPIEAAQNARSAETLATVGELADASAALPVRADLAERAEVEPGADPPTTDTADVIEPTPAPAEDPIGTVTIRIEDVFGNPIPRAKLHATQWRSVEDPGSSVWWGDEEARYMGESGLDGVVRLRYTRKQSPRGNEGTLTVGSVGFEITHPEYITHTEYGLDVADEETVVVLERGSFLIVSGWIDSPAERVVDVAAHLTFDVDVGPQDWIPIGDGRPSCSRIPPGTHGIYLGHVDETGQRWFSDVVAFDLADQERKELALELHAAGRLVGRLDDEVPRPVRDGEVELNLYVESENGAVMLRTYREEVEPDGGFAFTNLPPGAGEIIGLCEGWVSSRTQIAPSNWIEPEEEGGKRRWRRMWQLQQVDPAEHADEPFVLRMEPTANARITVEGPDGAPVEGARVTAWPNVHWQIGYASIFLDRTWEATTNALGVALLENMPARDGVYYGVQTVEGYLMPLQRPDDEGSRGARVDLAPGETTERTIRLDPPE